MRTFITNCIVFFCTITSSFSQTYVASSPLSYSNQSNIVIDGKSFTSGSNGASITLTNCTNVKITNCQFILTKDIIGIQLNSCTNVEMSGCYFENFRTGVYAVTCKGGINIHCNSFKNIAGIYPRGQIVQFNKCYGAGNRINYNILDHTFGTGDPEDLINMYGSYGTSADPIQIIGNKLRGGGPSKSGGGIMIGDDGGHDIRVEDNILVDVGQYGIGCPAGYNMTILNNKIYGAQKDWTNVGLYVGLQGEVNAGFDCLGNTIQVKNNQVKFYRKDGVPNGWYNCPCCPGVVQSGNNFNASITASILPTVLQLDENNCPSTLPTPALTCNTVPTGYQSVYCRDFETTTTKAGEYLKTNAWYFYDGGNSVTQYSHPELDRRFIIKQDPKNSSNKVIQLIKFDGDKDYSGYNPPLNPRTELSFRPSVERSTSKEIYFRLRTYFPENQVGVFSAEFIQFWLHGGTEEIPLQIEVRNGQFTARNPRTYGYVSPLPGKMLANYVGKWITWEVQAKFTNTGGYWKIYMDGEHVFTHTTSTANWPGSNGTWHPQFGAYANNGGAGQMECYFDDFMVAEKIQTVANTPPSVSITVPTNNSTSLAPASIIITANANDSDGTISKVEFFNGATKLGEKTTAPFTYSWTNVAAGNYTITAKATDNLGATTTSIGVSVQVVSPPIIGALQLINAGTSTVIPEFDSLPQTYSFATNMLQGTQHNIYATYTEIPDSVVFVYTKNGIQGKRKEGVAPYAMQGDGTGYTPWTITTGTYSITATAYKLGIATSSKTSSFTVTDAQVPGIIEAEQFNGGIQGVAHSDIDAINQGKEYRTSSGADIQTCTAGGYNVGWIADGEWLAYTLNVATTARYKVKLLVASTNANGRLQISQNGIALSPVVAIPNTGGWQTWTAVETEIQLNKGQQTIQLEFRIGSFNFDKFECIQLHSQTIALQKGWNLISTNLQLQDSTIETIFSGLDVQMIKDANEFWKKGQNSTLNSLKTITPGKGYLVYMNMAGTLSITGIPVSGEIFFAPIGWQLIGYPGVGVGELLFAPTPISNYFNTTNCIMIKNFDGFWVPNGATNSITSLEPGKGYFLKK